MTKAEIIQVTLTALRDGDVIWPSTPEADFSHTIENYEESVVIPTLLERLPGDVDIKTCTNFPDLGVACCRICHCFYPHYEMYLEDLPDGGKAWVCHSVRSALRGEPECDSDDLVDLVKALCGGLRDSTCDG